MNGFKVGFFGLVALAMVLSTTGCSSKSAGIRKVNRAVAEIENTIERRNLGGLDKYEAVALVKYNKVGLYGFGLMNYSGTIFYQEAGSEKFGPPSFVQGGGFSAGLAYGGLNSVDVLYLFTQRRHARQLARGNFTWNFSNEASFLFWGRKHITMYDVKTTTNGAGLCVGLLEAEGYVGSDRDSMQENLYGRRVSLTTIMDGRATPPEEIRPALDRLTMIMNEEVEGE